MTTIPGPDGREARGPGASAASGPIVVTGAAGKTGLAVVRSLAGRGARVRALIRRENQRSLVAEAGAEEVRRADLADPVALASAFDGAGSIYYICPNLRSDEVELGRLAIRASIRAGLERLVYHSVLHPQIEEMPHHWRKMRLEAALFESGLRWTVLQPAAYMQNLLAGWRSVVADGLFRVPYAVSSRLSLVALEDVGAAAARVCTEAGHDGATYELVGTEGLSQRQVAETLADVLGRSVRAVERPAAEVRAELEARGLDGYELDALMKMFSYYGRHGLEGSPSVLRWLLEREPVSLAAFVQESARRMADDAGH